MAGANNHTFDIGYSPLTCSLTSAGKTNETCNNNGTPSVSLNPTGTGLGTGYTVSVSGGASITPTSGTYGSANNFQLQNGSSNGTTYTITITDNATGACQVTTTVQQNSCSNACLLTVPSCPTDFMIDDFSGGGCFKFMTPGASFPQSDSLECTSSGALCSSRGIHLTMQSATAFAPLQMGTTTSSIPGHSTVLDISEGAGIDGTYYLTYDGTTGNGSSTPSLSPGLGGIDITGRNFQITVVTSDLNSPGVRTIDLVAKVWSDATHFSTSTVTLTSATADGSVITFPALSGNADLSSIKAIQLHFETNGVSIDALYDDFKMVCTALCNLTSAGKTNEACNSNNTQAITTDDYITFSLNPTGTGLGTGYTVTASGGATVTPTTGTYGNATSFRLQNGSANGTTYTITVTDNATGACQVTTTVMKTSCSTCPTPDCLNFQVIKN